MTRIEIASLAYGGDGVGRLPDGRTAFVAAACPGDEVDVEVTEDHGRFVRARIAELVRASDERVAPPCPYFGVCGGCQWQHVDYSAQLREKRAAVVDALERIGRLPDAGGLVADTVACSDRLGYRNKLEFVADPAKDRLTLGFHAARSASVVPIDECLLAPKRFRKAPKSIAGALRYLAGDGTLDISRVSLRMARNTRDLELALWTPAGAFPRAAAAKVLGQALPLTSLTRVLYRGDPTARDVTKVEVLSGRGAWQERLLGTDMTVSSPSFFQTNTPLAERLIELVLTALEPDGSDRVVDLYSGAGTFTLPLAERAGEVVAVESSGPAVRDLRRNLENNQLWADVLGGDAAREISELGHFDLAVVDPPRAGLAEAVIDALSARRPRALAYVSCDPATLARDAARLAHAGLHLTQATPVDLFPQTFHVEIVARFEPRG